MSPRRNPRRGADLEHIKPTVDVVVTEARRQRERFLRVWRLLGGPEVQDAVAEDLAEGTVTAEEAARVIANLEERAAKAAQELASYEASDVEAAEGEEANQC